MARMEISSRFRASSHIPSPSGSVADLIRQFPGWMLAHSGHVADLTTIEIQILLMQQLLNKLL